MNNNVEAKLARHSQMKASRQPNEALWDDCYHWTHPERGQGFFGQGSDANANQAKKADQTDSTAPDSANVCASEIHSGMTPANSRWFGLTVQGTDEEGRRWLDSAANVLWENIHQANFDAAGFECCLDVVDAGWFALYVDVDRKDGGFVFDQWPIYQVFCASSKIGGVIDIVHREYELTALQVVEEFGADNVSADVRKLVADNKGQENIQLLHIIEPRQLYMPGAKMAKNLPVASCHLEMKSKHQLRESGYHEMPVMVPRWRMIPGSVYATGPVRDCLPTIKRLNYLTRMEMASAELAVAGMWIVKDDGVLNPRSVKVGPRKVIVANDTESMKALQTGANFQLAAEMTDRMQAQIRKALLADAIPPIDAGQRTAYEYSVRINMLRKLLGPVFGRLQSEYLSLLVVRCFGLAYRAGVFDQPPESLAGQSFTVKYIGPLARAQKLEEAQAIAQFVASTLETAQAGAPEAMDNVDVDAATRLGGEALGVPAEVIRKQQDVQKVRDARAQAQQEQQQNAMGNELAMSAGDAMIKKVANQ